MKRSLALLMAVFFLSSTALATAASAEDKSGKLSSFEEEIGKPAAETPQDTSGVSAGDIAMQGAIEMFMQFLLMGFMQTGMEGFQGLYKDLKKEWSPALPTIRIEPSYQYLVGGLSSFSVKAEAGYLVLGVDGEYSRIFEKSPNNSLDMWTVHGLLRSIFTRHFGTNLALGARVIKGGQRRTGMDIGLPFYIFFNRNFVFDVLPYFTTLRGNTVYDLGAGLSFKYKLFGVRAGYRALLVGDEKLHGPRVGVFFQW
ncbi:MAG: hypothetical protein V2A66_09000 [Pseudomonadota bacterium]